MLIRHLARPLVNDAGPVEHHHEGPLPAGHVALQDLHRVPVEGVGRLERGDAHDLGDAMVLATATGSYGWSGRSPVWLSSHLSGLTMRWMTMGCSSSSSTRGSNRRSNSGTRSTLGPAYRLIHRFPEYGGSGTF